MTIARLFFTKSMLVAAVNVPNNRIRSIQKSQNILHTVTHAIKCHARSEQLGTSDININIIFMKKLFPSVSLFNS